VNGNERPVALVFAVTAVATAQIENSSIVSGMPLATTLLRLLGSHNLPLTRAASM
jgi:hypothetical protein